MVRILWILPGFHVPFCPFVEPLTRTQASKRFPTLEDFGPVAGGIDDLWTQPFVLAETVFTEELVLYGIPLYRLYAVAEVLAALLWDGTFLDLGGLA